MLCLLPSPMAQARTSGRPGLPLFAWHRDVFSILGS